MYRCNGAPQGPDPGGPRPADRHRDTDQEGHTRGRHQPKVANDTPPRQHKPSSRSVVDTETPSPLGSEGADTDPGLEEEGHYPEEPAGQGGGHAEEGGHYGGGDYHDGNQRHYRSIDDPLIYLKQNSYFLMLHITLGCAVCL